MAARRARRGALLWAADDWLATALVPRLGAAGWRVAMLSPAVKEEHGGAGEERWELPTPRREETASALARVWAGLAECDAAVVETRLVDSGGEEAGDWEAGLGERLWRSFEVARAAAQHMGERGGGAIVLLAVDRDSDSPWPEADVCRAAVVNLVHGLAKAVAPGVRVGAVVSGPVEEARPSGQRQRCTSSAVRVGEAVISLLQSATWATGSVIHIAGD